MERVVALEVLDELHRAQNEFYAGGDGAPLRRILAEEVAWHVPGASAIAGTHHGVEAVVDYFARRRALAGGTFRLRRLDVLSGEGDRVAALTDGTARVGGVDHSWSTVGLYDLGGRRVRECWLLPLDPVAFDAIWSP